MKPRRLRATVPVVLLFAGVVCLAQEVKPPENSDVTTANQLYQAGKFSEAIQKYQQALKADPALIPAQAGLVRAYLRADQVDPAYDLAKSSLTANPNSAPLLAAMGSVQYRRGELAECETSFISAKKIDPNLVEPYLGLVRVYRTALLYRRAYDQLKRAHEIAPQNAEVQRLWIGMMPRRDRIPALAGSVSRQHASRQSRRNRIA